MVNAEDGSVHVIETVGEALDASDKASAKAMTAAYKHGVLQTFCVPPSGREDPDACSPRAHRHAARVPAPVEGWAQWAEDMAAVVGSCACGEAIDRLLASNRAQLGALAREQATLYHELGRAIADRRSVLARPVAAEATSAAPASASRARRTPRLASKSEARAEHQTARAPQPVRKRAGLNQLTIEVAPKQRPARKRSQGAPTRRPDPAPGSTKKGVLEHV